jgi:hypothetical protein
MIDVGTWPTMKALRCEDYASTWARDHFPYLNERKERERMQDIIIYLQIFYITQEFAFRNAATMQDNIVCERSRSNDKQE